MDIGEIAARAGVSRSTVSYALSGKRPISAATRSRIESIMRELDFVPNAAAQALKRGTSQILALSLPHSSRGHLLSGQLGLVGAVTEAAADRERDLLLSPTGDGRQAGFQRLLAQRRIDGVIVIEVEVNDRRVEQLERSGIPFVAIGHTRDSAGYDWVDVDYERIVSSCVDRLVSLNRSRIALINRSATRVKNGYGPAVRAKSAWQAALKRHGATGEALSCEDSVGASFAFVRRLLDRMPDVDGIVTINEEALPTLLPALNAAGRSVPGDVSVCGVALKHVAESLMPSLTACDLPLLEIGRIAVDRLMSKLAGEASVAGVGQLLRPPLVIRQT